MWKSRVNRSPTFLWQAALIVLPVAILAGVGLSSLRQDRLLVEQEARERAQQFADLLAEKIGASLANTAFPKGVDALNDGQTADDRIVRFQISARNELLYPPKTGSLEPCLLDAAELSDRQVGLWKAARTAEFTGSDTTSVIDSYRRFLAAEPPRQFAAVACFSLGLSLAKGRQRAEAAAQFALAAGEYPDATLESGLPLRPLADMKRMEMAGADRSVQLSPAWLDAACSNAVFNPTAVTPRLLEQAALLDKTGDARVGLWRTVWERHQRARQLYADARRLAGDGSPALATITGIMDDPQFGAARHLADAPTNNAAADGLVAPLPALFWIGSGESWLAALLAPDAAGRWIVCRRESEIQRMVRQQINDERNLPSYFGASVELAGRLFVGTTNPAPSSTGPSRPAGPDFGPVRSTAPVLAVNRGRPGIADPFSVRVHLTDPAALYARQRARTISFGLLIAISTGVALAGLLTAWNAFRRQQRLAEMKTNFVSSVSHELRAPIASVRLMAESLDRGKISAEGKRADYYRLIVQECRRLTALIENVLDFSRIDQGRKKYEFEPTDLAALVQQTMSLMEPYATERHVMLNMSTAPHQLSTLNSQLEMDGRAIQQALVNLLDNAIKHSPAGAVVEVGWGPSPNPDSSALHLYVQDHGDGIPAAEHGKIFEPFYRRGAELRRETPGIGIGLTIVKHIVEGHGGRVLVQSEVGKGSRFTIELPLGQSPKPDIQ